MRSKVFIHILRDTEIIQFMIADRQQIIVGHRKDFITDMTIHSVLERRVTWRAGRKGI